jgi:hypothetical protein
MEVTLIEQVKWPQSTMGEALSPFLRGNRERPLRITLHSSSFSRASDEDTEAISAIRDLSTVSEIQAVDTEPGRLPRLQIGTFIPENQEIPITVTGRGPEIELQTWTLTAKTQPLV